MKIKIQSVYKLGEDVLSRAKKTTITQNLTCNFSWDEIRSILRPKYFLWCRKQRRLRH